MRRAVRIEFYTEIFGEENKLAQFNLESKSFSSGCAFFKIYHEYIKCYALNKQQVDVSLSATGMIAGQQ